MTDSPNITELTTTDIVPLFTLSEFVNSPNAPVIPMPKDVDLKALREALGGEIVSAVLPIGIVDVKSLNGRVYRESSVKSLVRQVNEMRPEGRWGHLTVEEFGTKYEPPAVRWVAAVMKGDKAWGKAIALTAEAATHFKAAAAMSAMIGTSIFGIRPTGEGVDVLDYKLVTIDLGNPSRIGVEELGVIPAVTKEMQTDVSEQGSSPDNTDVNLSTSNLGGTMPTEDKSSTGTVAETQLVLNYTEQIRELRTKDASQQTEIAELRPYRDDVKQIRELMGLRDGDSLVSAATVMFKQIAALRELFSVNGETDLARTISEFKAQHDALVKESADLVDATIATAVAEKVKPQGALAIVTEMVKERKPATRAAVSAALDDVLAKPATKALLQTLLVTEMGGNLNPSPKSPTSGNPYFDIPEVK